MDRTQKEYLDSMESLFGHPGWKHIEDDAKRRIYQLQADALDANICKTWDLVNLARGQAIALAELLNLPDTVANQRDAAIHADV